MAKDYYKTLGVDKNASKDEIKKAFRKLAHEHHPDKKDGNADKFKEASEAYSVLSDDQKRSQYDQFGSSGPQGYGGGQPGGFDFNGFDFSQFGFGGGQQGFGQDSVEFDLGDILGGIFGGGRRVRRGANITVDVDILFKESVFGTERQISYTKSSTKKKESFAIKIPPGMDSGEMLRVTGRGEEAEGGNPGDLFVRVHVKADKALTKEGHNLVTTFNIKLSEALLGGERTIMSPDGDLTVKIPEGVASGETLRVRGKGVAFDASRTHRGDLLIHVRIEMPKKLNKESKKLIEQLKEQGL
ncbi:MAG: J domain-containing protein [Patescibacteria group bacterium]